jgi:hypothetical protein
MSRAIAHLNVWKLRDGVYRYSLDQPGAVGAIGLELQVEIQTQDLVAFSRDVSNSIADARLAAGPQTASIDSHIAEICKGLYRTLFHGRSDIPLEPLRRALQTLKSPLLITTDDGATFWELLHDGLDFLGLKYDIGRRLKTRLLPVPVARPQRQWRALLVADPNADEPQWALSAASAEGKRVRHWLEKRGVNCEDYLDGARATRDAVLRKMASHEYDIIHYAGHVVFDLSRETYGLRLNGGDLFNATTIEEQLRGAPIVFLNGCWSAGAPAQDNASPDNGSGAAGQQTKKVETLTDAFLRAGSQIVVGSLFAVPDEGACLFAEKYYESLLDGCSAGEAMRLSRKSIFGRASCGAAWACFVMYGDPSLAPFQDDLQAALRSIGFARAEFDGGAFAVLEAARQGARMSRLIGSAELLYAMLDGHDSYLRDRLKDRGAPADRLREELRTVFASALANHDEGLQFSEHVRTILTLARDAAKSRGSTISERDLVRGFARRPAGRAKLIIGRVLAPQDLDPDAGTKPLMALCERVGPLRPGDCETDVWRILIYAAGAVIRAKSGDPITTEDLFAAMRQNTQSLLARALTRFGLPLTSGAAADPMPFSAPFMACSENAAAILAEARNIASREKRSRVSEHNLLCAFVRTGGGARGLLLREQGFVLETLLSDLFTDAGEMDFSKFDEGAAEIVRAAIAVGRKKGRERWGPNELLFGFLSAPGGCLPTRIRDSGADVDEMKNVWYARLKSGRMLSSNLGLHASDMEPELQRLFCLTESSTHRQPQDRVREKHLFRGLLDEGGGEAVEFLIKMKLNLQQLYDGLP